MNAHMTMLKEQLTQRYPSLRAAYADRVERFGPSDYDKLFSTFRNLPADSLDLITMVSLLRATDWDADLFFIFSPAIVEKLSNVDEIDGFLREAIAEGMLEVDKRFFLIDTNWDTISEIGRVLVQLKRYSTAAIFYRRFLEIRPDSAVAMTNLAVCLHLGGDGEEEVMELLHRAVALERPNEHLAKDWLRHVTFLKSQGEGAEKEEL